MSTKTGCDGPFLINLPFEINKPSGRITVVLPVKWHFLTIRALIAIEVAIAAEDHYCKSNFHPCDHKITH